MSSILYDADHWRARADQARTLAEQMTDPLSKATMLKIAEGYEEMAKHALARRQSRQADLTTRPN